MSTSIAPLGTLAKRPSLPPGAASWTELVASTTVGLSGFGRLRVMVRCSPRARGVENYRLVVHLYDENDELELRWLRPRASAQRAVTLEELAHGVEVTLLAPGAELSVPPSGRGDRARVVAWVEPGEPDLDYDGAEARPSSPMFRGSAPVRSCVPRAVVLVSDQVVSDEAA